MALFSLTLSLSPLTDAQAQGTEPPPGIRAGVAQTNGIKVTLPNGFATISQTDMSVASVGGAVNWSRYWDGREWKFNPHWESLSVSWSNLTAGRMSGGDDLLIGRAGCDRLTDPDCKEPPNDNSCWVWVDEDWQPSGERVLLGGGGTSASYEFVAEPVPPIRGTPFNKIIGGDASASEYGSGTWVNADWLALCPGGGGGGNASAAFSQGQELEGIRRINELYLGEGGRYAFSNRSVLERRAVREMPTTTVAQLTSGQVSATPVDNPKGYRWIDRSGAWIDYNTQGQVVAYGERNNIPVWLVRNEAGVVRGVVDANGRVIYSLHYSGELITEVRDYPVSGLEGDLPARSVRYQYNAGNRLSEVTDVRGHVTRYGYDRSGRINRVTDAEERVETLAYKDGLVSQHTAADGGVTDYAFSYDEVNKQFNSKITGPQTAAGRRVEEQTHNRIGKLVRQVVNGRTDLEMKYDSGARIEASTNARGFTSYVQRNEFEQGTRVTHEDGSSLRSAYSAVHLEMTEQTDELGVKTQYLHDDKGNLLSEVEAVGTVEQRTTEYNVNELGQVTQIIRKGRTESNGTVSPDAIWQLEYDSQGQLSRTTDPEGAVRTYVVGRMGNLLKATDPRGHATTYEANAAGELTKQTNALGHSQQYTYDRVGNLVSELDARGKATLMAYDAMNRLSARTHALEGVSRSTHDAANTLVSDTDEDGRATRLEYDNFQRLIKHVDGSDNVTQFGYQINDGTSTGQLGSLLEPVQVDYPTFSQSNRFDARERPTLQTLKYRNSQGEQAEPSAATYDRRGQVLTETDPSGSMRRFIYDALGQRTEVVDALNGVTRYQFDVRGNLLQMTDANGNSHRFEYDRNDRLVKETRPLGQVRQFEYDASGNMVKRIEPSGVQYQFTFDAANRLINIEHKRSDESLMRSVTQAWDANNNLVAWEDRDEARNQTSSAALIYDDVNRKISETLTYPNGYSLSFSYGYSLAGKKTRLVWADGTTIDYGYNASGDLDSVTIPGEGVLAINEFAWGAPKKATLPGGVTQNWVHDGLLNTESFDVRTPGQQSTLSLDHRFGKQQEITSRNRTDTAGGQSSTRNEQFSYDAELRLTQVQRDAGGLFGTSTQSYTLDAVANRTADSQVSGEWQYDANNRLIKIGSGACATAGVICHEWDVNGNLSKKIQSTLTTLYRYDSHNRLTDVAHEVGGVDLLVARYGYDPMDRRIWKEQFRDKSGAALAQATRTYYFYSDEGLIAEARQLIELNANGSVEEVGEPQITSQYGPRPDSEFTTGMLFVKTTNSNGHVVYGYYHHDHLGTPIQATDKQGNVIWAAAYDAFGRAAIITPAATTETPTISSQLRLPGQYEDQETGLHYNFRRFFDPDSGRYVTEDPIGLEGGSNLFVYVNGSPTILMDPTGEVFPVIVVLGRILATGAAFCAKNPKLCREIYRCAKNPPSCKQRFCKIMRSKTLYHPFCDFPGCDRMTSSIGRDAATKAASACLGLRLMVRSVCFSGARDPKHDEEIHKARDKLNRCKSICQRG
ncbi:RHS repeat-associated protein [Hydrogenophaga palleronii]|uniref:RHS repeat-associated protein n=1 Tax=Hydrogenophaga palleronii TaxID=65655 RepID=A0ABU1WTY9_9BURK|nr:RHS repeat-associated core domain-containing protein [Hydrogenophaga palleronii]MDR7152750.1 RHS repeat-associated protein [Hydrogenophaga palleronii]